MHKWAKVFLSVDSLVIACLIIYSLAVWYPTRFEPYHWDSAGFINTAAEILKNTNFNPLIVTGSDFAHPPLIPILLAIVKKFVSTSLLASHLLMLPFLPVLLVSSYLVGKKCGGWIIGTGLSFLLAVTPVILAEYGIIYLDLPVAAFVMVAVLLWMHKKPLASMIMFTLAVLTKETALLALPFFVVFSPSSKTKSIRLYLLIPLISLGIYLLYHYQVTGWVLADPNARAGSRILQSFSEFIAVVKKIYLVTFQEQLRWLIAVPALISLFLLIKNKAQVSHSTRKVLQSSAAVLVTGLIFYCIVTEYAPRYTIIFLPFIYLFTLVSLQTILKMKVQDKSTLIVGLYVLLVSVAFMTAWRPKRPLLESYDYRPPSDLRYQDYSRIFRQAAGIVSGQYADKTIVGSFPENLYLTDPAAGYISKSVRFKSCDVVDPIQEKYFVVIIHPFSPGQQACRALLNRYSSQLFTTLTSSDKWLEIYEITATPSALPAPTTI